MIEFVFHTDTGSEEADGSNDQPLLPALYRLHQFGHQPPLQYVAFDPAWHDKVQFVLLCIQQTAFAGI